MVESQVKQTIKKFKLLTKKDKILVAVSGGKDSSTILYLLKKLGYDIQAIHIELNSGKYFRANLKNIRKFCKKLNIKLHEVAFREMWGFSVCYAQTLLKSKGLNLKSCSVCGVLKRYILNKEARKLKFTKIVTGHNLDDEAQTILMNQLRGNFELNAKLGPIAGLLKTKKFVPRVKPLYLTPEEQIKKYSKKQKFPVVYDPCPCSIDALRFNVKKFLKDFPEKTKLNIVKSFLEILPDLKNFYKSSKLKECEKCQEPTARKICKTCELLEKIKQ